mmetsp:Transcript_9223/g.16634  ORF Transcript_9223/g.16634 Transcript_9223/m.16634 type:complete len:227 (-) Transcript_9223:73-753(-)
MLKARWCVAKSISFPISLIMLKIALSLVCLASTGYGKSLQFSSRVSKTIDTDTSLPVDQSTYAIPTLSSLHAFARLILTRNPTVGFSLPALGKTLTVQKHAPNVRMSGPVPAPGCDGTVFTVLKEGAGETTVTKGAQVKVHATGVVKETGKKFWSTKDPGQFPFEYQAGVGQVIKGWDQGLLGMKVGEQRQVVIPAKEGYGEGGFPAWGIPPGGTLDFTLEVLEIK